MGDDLYLYMIIALAILAISDLVVGVSNDAVNFLNSALGSKAISFRTIMIVASIGIAFGAMSSSGMMEVARKGIFVPGEFMFSEIMIIFMAVMITDVLLLDFFNTLGMPTSTTVSIVFELLGAAVITSLIKMSAADESFLNLGNYINNDKAIEIILGIVLSVLIAFTIGALIQFLSRLFLTFEFQKKATWKASVFGGLAIAGIVYFILIKGLSSTNLFNGLVIDFVEQNTLLFLVGNAIVWSLVCGLLQSLAKLNIYQIIIVFGTFALAMAFAGNDLVNFIGVPIAAYQSFLDWSASGVGADNYAMDGLAAAVQTPTLLLLLSGVVMILTLWFSTKALFVTETEINLAREGEGEERFRPNYLSRQIVRLTVAAVETISSLPPEKVQAAISRRFERAPSYTSRVQAKEKPAFDMVRASVNLMVASVLISIATSMKLPLSTTYVTFMVAMGTSLADRAWGSESAVYRVAGVLNVIGGWFLTAITAFTGAGIVAYLIYLGGAWAIGLLFVLALVILIRNYLNHKKRSRELKEEYVLRRTESSTISEVIEDSADNVAVAIKRVNKIYTSSMEGLVKHDLNSLKKSTKHIRKLDTEVENLRESIFYFIKNLDEGSVKASNLYLQILRYLQDMTQSLEHISKSSYKHVNNNHKKLRFQQLRDLKETDSFVSGFFKEVQEIFSEGNFEELTQTLIRQEELLQRVDAKIRKQIERTRGDESSPKNTALYFNLLQETRDLLEATFKLMEIYDVNINKIELEL
ncbi:inorganic phosphate transporter [Robiginitalea biformata]|uniref:Phosphate transporter n=1 Tax=Robiginitalea biformata (strain ATCC BAA-864 / DSM 15991 / KCTC 12146 / HTCC2501) TaxID=313596 RepID=A4CHF1_ROBBH|nr:inorganic phosphate transporter [Robiginitalea biformata]EAR16359.1 phosphate sodium symporter [Robiginitalea biformata HTCC2501]